MQNTDFRVIFVSIVAMTVLILITICFVVTILFIYERKQFTFYKGLSQLRMDYEKDLLKTHLEIQEQTFQSISSEIHDNIGQVLTLAKFHLNSLSNVESEKTSSQLKDSIDLISEAISDLSDISRSLSSEIIVNNGLIRALEFEFERINHIASIHIDFKVVGECFYLDLNKEILIFRIIQEALSNVVRHANAPNVEITLIYDDHILEIEISDDGIGFDPINKRDGKIYLNAGISNMQKRAKIMGAVFTIKTSKGRGTVVKIIIPLNLQTNEISK